MNRGTFQLLNRDADALIGAFVDDSCLSVVYLSVAVARSWKRRLGVQRQNERQVRRKLGISHRRRGVKILTRHQEWTEPQMLSIGRHVKFDARASKF